MDWMPNWLRRFWYGRYHATLVRQITNEEHVSITFSERTKQDFDERLGTLLGVCREHMLKHNNQVVLGMRGQINGLMREIDEKGKELDNLKEQIERKRKKLPLEAANLTPQ